MVSAFLRPSIDGSICLHLHLHPHPHLQKLVGALRPTAVRAQLPLHSRLNLSDILFPRPVIVSSGTRCRFVYTVSVP